MSVVKFNVGGFGGGGGANEVDFEEVRPRLIFQTSVSGLSFLEMLIALFVSQLWPKTQLLFDLEIAF